MTAQLILSLASPLTHASYTYINDHLTIRPFAKSGCRGTHILFI